MRATGKIALMAALALSGSCFVVGQAPATAPATATAADQQPTKEQMQQLFEVMRIREQTAEMMKTLPQMIQQQVRGQAAELAAKNPGGAEQQAAVDKLMEKFMTKAMNVYPVEEMLDDMASIYRRHVSRADVDAFIVFYGSPAGQHLLDAQPVILKEYMPLVMQRIDQRSKALMGEFLKERDELLKTAPPAPPKAQTVEGKS